MRDPVCYFCKADLKSGKRWSLNITADRAVHNGRVGITWANYLCPYCAKLVWGKEWKDNSEGSENLRLILQVLLLPKRNLKKKWNPTERER